MCYGYCREEWLFAVGTVGDSGCVHFVLQGTLDECCGFCSEQCVCAVGTVENSVCEPWAQ